MQRGQAPAMIMVLLVVTVLINSASSLLAKQTAPPSSAAPSLAKVGLYPTQVVATVKSLQQVKSPAIDAGIGENQTLFLVKLRIHTTKALTLQGTVINDEESLDVISRESLDAASIGKTVTAQIEMRSDSTRQRWLMSDIIVRSR
jgi:hypothetical protein